MRVKKKDSDQSLETDAKSSAWLLAVVPIVWLAESRDFMKKELAYTFKEIDFFLIFITNLLSLMQW